MFIGHLAVAFGAAFGLDLLWPIFLILGLETVQIHPGDTAFTHLAFESYPWSQGPLAGLGLWNSIPGTILVEGGLFALCLWSYLGVSSARDRIGRWAFWIEAHRGR